MKQRFSSLDVKVITYELANSLISLRLANVYDLSSRIFLLKFAKPDQRRQVVVESGFRCHLTNFTRATAAAPSPFVSRLRKYLRSRRVTSVSQVGTDRVIDFQFSDGQYRLFLEFYAGGNIVLTDRDLSILALLRVVSEGADQEELRVGLKYSLSSRQNYSGVPQLTKERVRHAVQTAAGQVGEDATVTKRKSNKRSGHVLRKALTTSLSEFPPMLIDHALRLKEFDADTPLMDILNNDAYLDRLFRVLEGAQETINHITSIPVTRGFIVAKKKASTAIERGIERPVHPGLVYEDFHPFRPAQFEGVPETHILEIEGYNKTVDEFFSSIESQKLESRLTEREEHAQKKLDAARQDHERRIGGLQHEQELNVRKAQAIEANLQKVQEAIAAVNGLISQGMDWVEIARLIEIERTRHSPVAEMIKLPLKLYENTVTLLLAEVNFNDEEDYDGDETDSDVSELHEEAISDLKTSKQTKIGDERLAVDVDLASSPWSNARQYYDQKRSAAVKEHKTSQASSKALRSTEKKVNADLKKGLKQEKQMMRPVRMQLWFEKFLYFISSEGYLVLGGRDVQQNEILYRRYLGRGDAYIHADLQGAASIIVKNKPGVLDNPIPPSTLLQAGSLAVATSSAWESKAVMSAWWVHSHQVSKTAPTGEYLPTGSFAIRGQKEYLPPAQPLLGFGVMFRVSEESKARHFKHRVVEELSPKKTHLWNGDEGEAEEKESADASEVIADDSQTAHGSNLDERDDFEHNKTIKDEDQGKSKDAPSGRGNEGEDIDSEDPEAGQVDQQSEYDLPSAYYGSNPLQPHLHMQREEDESSANSGQESQNIQENDNGDLSFAEAAKSEDSEVRSGQEQDLPSLLNDEGAISGVRHLSAREPQILRQNRPGTADDSGSDNQLTRQNTQDADSSHDATLNGTEKFDTKPFAKMKTTQVRGKHGKRNKLKTKYADQDEEDRTLALQILGSAAGQQLAAENATAKATKEQELAAQKERRRKQHAAAAEKEKQAEEIRRTNLEDGTGTLDANESESLGDLDSFIGTPLPGDEILDALVVCGPWDAIGGRCRWRAKLSPGATKKGRAVREILSVWTAGIADREKKTRPPKMGEETGLSGDAQVMVQEAELIKAIREQEVIGEISYRTYPFCRARLEFANCTGCYVSIRTSAALRSLFMTAAAVSPSLSSMPSTNIALTFFWSNSRRAENRPRAMALVSFPNSTIHTCISASGELP